MKVLISMLVLADDVDAHEATTRAREGWESERLHELKGTVIEKCGAHVVITIPETRSSEWNSMVDMLDLNECEFREHTPGVKQ